MIDKNRQKALICQKIHKNKMSLHVNKHRTKVTYKLNDKVMYYIGDRLVGNKLKLEKNWIGPFTVISILTPVTYLISNDSTGRVIKAVTQLLKKYYSRNTYLNSNKTEIISNKILNKSKMKSKNPELKFNKKSKTKRYSKLKHNRSLNRNIILPFNH